MPHPYEMSKMPYVTTAALAKPGKPHKRPSITVLDQPLYASAYLHSSKPSFDPSEFHLSREELGRGRSAKYYIEQLLDKIFARLNDIPWGKFIVGSMLINF